MPDHTALALIPESTGAAPALAPCVQREKFIGFVCDEASALALHEALGGALPEDCRIHVQPFRAALAKLEAMSTPEIVLIDMSSEEQPINAMTELADAVDAGTIVLGIGDIQNVNFYRTITKGMGITEYLPKPLSRAALEKNFLPVIQNLQPEHAAPRGGRVISIAGARGGVGASTIAANLAWMIGSFLHRHTLLLDSELYSGTAALNFDLGIIHGLGTVLANPERLDTLLVERSTQRASERVDVLAEQELLNRDVDYKPGSAPVLIQTVRNRYNYVIADAGARLEPFARDLMSLAQQRVIVMDPSIIAIRNTEKLLTLPAGPAQSPRTMFVLNKAGTPGGLRQSYMEQTMGMRFDAVIPDLPRIVLKTTQYGTQAASLRGPFRDGITALATALGATSFAEAA